MMFRIKKGDNIVAIAGKNFGQKAKVLKLFPKTGQLIAEGLNMHKRRQKPRKAGERGQVLEVASPLNLSNVLPWCNSCGKGVRVGVKVINNKRTRVCRRCAKTL